MARNDDALGQPYGISRMVTERGEQALEMMAVKAAHILDWNDQIGLLEQQKGDIATFELNHAHL